MSTPHIFYIPVIHVVGILAGYFIGRWSAEEDEKERRRKAKRRAAIKKSKTEGEAAQATD